MGWELRFLASGSVAVYCSTMSQLTGQLYYSLQSFQELYGFIHHRDGKEKDPRSFTDQDYIEWVETLGDDEDFEIDPPEVYRTPFKDCGEFSFGMLPENVQTFLRETYGYFA